MVFNGAGDKAENRRELKIKGEIEDSTSDFDRRSYRRDLLS